MRYFLALLLVAVVACAPRSPSPAHEEPERLAPVTADSPLAKIEWGMGVREVESILGPPTDMHSSVTGKVFIPFYFGGDAAEVVMHYKGIGRVILATGVARQTPGVIRVEEDPTETGFYRSR